MTDPAQTFRMLNSEGEEIASGSLPALMEHLPDTPAREAALDQMLKTAAEAVEAEQRRDEARACTVQMISDALTRLTDRLEREEQWRKDKARRDAEEAKRKEQEEIQRTLDQLPDPDNPNPDEPDEPYAYDQKEREASLTGNDDGELELKHEVDPEKYGDDQEQPKPALSYGKVPLSYVKKKDAEGDLPEGLENRSPAPLGTDPVYDPADLGGAKDPKQVSQPISFNNP
jgi:hypothetical protein